MKEMSIKPYKHTVKYYETDKMGITHHSNYVRWMEEARIDFLSQIGWDYDRMEKLGVISPVVSINCRYLDPTTFPDEVEITIKPGRFNGVVLELNYTMTTQGDRIVCKANSTHAFVNEQGNPLRLQRNLPELYDRLAGLLDQEKTEE